MTETYFSGVNGCPNSDGADERRFCALLDQVMYEMRGFGYYTFNETANDGNPVVPMTSSGAVPTAASVATAIATVHALSCARNEFHRAHRK